jgi:Na+-transporting NADH:ubiquinone oxidoreductase subunit A
MVERFEIGRGLAVPMQGEPEQKVDAKEVSQVAIVADDYVGMRPTLLVSEGDRVELGQPIFSDKKTEGVVFTAPAGGKVLSINRAEKRRFQSLVIEKGGSQQSRSFASYDLGQVATLGRDKVVQQLTESGLWTSLRTRPFSKVPSPASVPQAIFVNAMDTNPLAAIPSPVVAENKEDFRAGVEVLGRLTEGNVYVCRHPKSEVPGEGIRKVIVAEFDGPHPAGLSGTHMHFLRPAAPVGELTGLSTIKM